MNTNERTGSGATDSPVRWKLIGAFAVVYLVWGSTCLFIRIGVADIPPAVLAGLRFVADGIGSVFFGLARGGALLFGWAVLGEVLPAPAQALTIQPGESVHSPNRATAYNIPADNPRSAQNFPACDDSSRRSARPRSNPLSHPAARTRHSATMDKHLIRRLVILGVFLIVLFGAIFGWRAFVNQQAQEALAKAPPRRISVSTASVQQVSWPDELQATASLQAVQGTLLTPQLAGMVTAIDFHSGEAVKKGQLLIQFNDANQRAQRANDASALKLAKIKLAQQRKLYRTHNTSQLNLQSTETTYAQARAALSADDATIAKLQIRAPFDGHLGLRQVSLGQYVDTATPVVTLQQWDPIHVEFQVPQQELNKLKTGQTVALEIPGSQGERFTGKLTAIGALVKPGTRNVEVQATLANPAGKLRPGMYGEVTLDTGHARTVLAVPESAITYNTYGSYVYVVEKGAKGTVAKERTVQTGESRNGQTVIAKGLKAGERVVIAGQVKLHSGALVTVTKPAPGAGSAGSGSAL